MVRRKSKQNRSRLLRIKLRGFVFRPQADPPSISTLPWSNLTFIVEKDVTDSTGVVTTSILYSDVYSSALKHFFGTDYSVSALLRIKEIRIWNLSGKSFQAEFISLLSDRRVISTLQDFPGRNQWARVGFEYPVAHQNVSLSTTSQDSEVFLKLMNWKKSAFLIQIRALIRSINVLNL